MKVGCRVIKRGIELEIDGKKFDLEFPIEVWRDYPNDLKKIYIDNFAFLKSLHIPLFLKNVKKIKFETGYPLFKEQIYNAMLNNIPFCSDIDGVSTAENIKRFINLQFNFKKHDIIKPSFNKKLNEKSVISFSFGKDSLLTFALADELGLSPELIMSVDNDCTLENKYKAKNVDKFSREVKKKVWKIKNNTAIIHRYYYWRHPKSEWGYGHLMTEFCFNALPFANYLQARYIFLGDEQSCNDWYTNDEGYLSYPIYDQSSDWAIELTKMMQCLTNYQARVVSLIEPIHELAITKILHNRYPNIGKYQMSCFPDDNPHGKSHFWCQHCSKCARIFIFMKANKLDPSIIGFNTNMLNLKFRDIFPLFGIGRKDAVGYDASNCGRDEQLYAFYLAYKNGVKGEIIELFKKRHLKEAKEREEELYKKFFGIHKSKTIPRKLIKPLYSIYKEELI